MNQVIKILLIEDHGIVREGVKGIISQHEGMYVTEECDNAEDALHILTNHIPDVILCDITLADTDGIELIAKIKKKYPNIKVIILSSHNEEYFVLRALEVNTDGYLHKSILKKELIEGILKVYKGEKYFSQAVSQIIINNMVNKRTGNSGAAAFTPREKEILKLITEGYSNREISDKLFISIKTVDTHRTSLLKKSDAKNTAELVKFAIENKLV
ncbi:response regulator [Eisenibacter elegans]|jgi:DNA-binding NarL/FixJ family response regulator|uniref:response regulator n=1 Tax=Eisenibacter elegans TaxID=997 RepID=UPI00040CEBA1|nr:response regulator transcription factor [Eisenibacter elegans]